MIKNKKKIMSILLIILSIISIGINSCAHSGRTDSSGGHKDSENKSGLGSYHYHCGGNPAHLHENGVCPYSSNSSTSIKTTSVVPSTIEVTDIKINEQVTDMEEGKSQKLTATITPDNANDKNIIWKSSDESIATVSSTGEVFAKKYGTVDITVTSSNGKSSSIRINIKELPKTENNKEDLNTIGKIMTVSLLAGGSYIGYQKYKKHNK